MTVPVQETINRYTGNGVTTVFPYSFYLLSPADLIVTVGGIVATSGFTVSGVGSQAGGNITFTVAPVNGASMVLERLVKLERTTDYQQNGDFLSNVVNPDFDRLWMAHQQQKTAIDRAIKIPAGDAPIDATLPPAANRANNLLGFDANGNPVAVAPAAQSATALQTLLAAPTGASNVGHLPPGAGAVATTVGNALNWNAVSAFHFMSEAQIADVRAKTYLLDVTVALAAATSYLTVLGGGDLIAPRGGYLLSGIAGADAYKNGILLSDTNGDFGTGKGINIIGEGVETVFRAGSANMVVVRHSRLYSGGESYKIDGAGLANVIGLAVAPESLTQTTELTSQSFAIYRNIKVENCTEGLLLQPGPTVLGADSGAFYHRFYDLDMNLNSRHIWMKKDVTGMGNRTTRSSFYGCTLTRGNTGVQIDGGTEIDFHSLNIESINTGVSPSASPTAFNYTDTNPSNIRLFGGYIENSTINITSVSPGQVQLFGFYHSGATDSSEYGMLRHGGGTINIPRAVTAGNPPVTITGVDSSFAGLTIDPDSDGSKTIVVQTNGTVRTRWFNGAMTHHGSLGTAKFDATGTELTFSYAGAIAFTGVASSTLYNSFDTMVYRSAAGAQLVRMDATGTLCFLPVTDNAVSLGKTGQRWSSVWAANGAIQTSDPRTKKDIVDSPLGLDFINALRPVAYKFKIGGNEVVGIREITPAVMRFDEELGKEVIDIPAVTENVVQSQPGKRQHFGFLTTEVKAAIGDVDFGGYVKVDMADPESEEALRYDEFIAPLVRAVQELSAEFNAYKLSHP